MELSRKRGHESCDYAKAAFTYMIDPAEYNFFDDGPRHASVKPAL